MAVSCPSFKQVQNGGKKVLADALSALEQVPDSLEVATLLDAAWVASRARQCHVLGLTGPPGVGKSTLISALISRWRNQNIAIGIIAVDPSSTRSGGAVLGDRTRLLTDPEDESIFVRSMAARDRLGGLAAITFPAVVLMRALFDVVIVETVGVGQSEIEIATVADTVIWCVQPGSGDSLQFMKAGIVEVPDIALVTKSDLGASARRALTDLTGAMGLAEKEKEGVSVKVLMVSATTGEGLKELTAAVDARWQEISDPVNLALVRTEHAKAWIRNTLLEQIGKSGAAKAGKKLSVPDGKPPFSYWRELLAGL